MARKKKKEECPKPAIWITTFADLVTLLLTFFVLLLSMSTMDNKKIKRALGSLTGALGVLESGRSTKIGKEIVVPQPDIQLRKSRVRKHLAGLKNFITVMGLGQLISTFESKKGIVVTIKDRLLFSPASAKLRKEAGPVLDKLSNIIKLMPDGSMVNVEGSTDNIPIKTGKYPSNWELSIARALSVVRYFIKHDFVSPVMLSAEGLGQFHPIATNQTAEGRSKNRRVDIVFVGIH